MQLRGDGQAEVGDDRRRLSPPACWGKEKG